MTHPLSSSRFAQVIARYGVDVTITKRREVRSDKPWLVTTALPNASNAAQIADENKIKARALIQEPRFVRQPEITSGDASRQIQQALIEVRDMSAEALSAAIVQTQAQYYLIARPSLVAQQGKKMIFKVALLAQKGRL